ncbi:MAG: helix-turn-helix transcriptional regulator [Candidatus Bathyarchaeota archaeon]
MKTHSEEQVEQVKSLLRKGKTYEEIAKECNLPPETVKKYIKNIIEEEFSEEDVKLSFESCCH